MKNKGFTLVELLAVIVVLAIISIITIPMIGNVIEESKKKSLEQSASGLIEAASYYKISHEGVTEFVFDENKKGETIKGDKLEYKGNIEGTGKLYIDKNGDISLCLVDDKYYVYKNYNSGIYVGEVKDNSCIIGYDVLTNKYVAMLDDGTGQISNVYSKDEVNNLIYNVDSKVTTNKNEITNIKSTIETLQSSLNSTNNDLDRLSSIVSSNTDAIGNLNSNLQSQINDNTNNISLLKNSIDDVNGNFVGFIDTENVIVPSTKLPSSTTPVSYTATENCYVVCTIYGNVTSSGYFAINNIRLFEWNNQTSTTMFNTVTYPVKSGQVVTMRNYGNTGNYAVYGCK